MLILRISQKYLWMVHIKETHELGGGRVNREWLHGTTSQKKIIRGRTNSSSHGQGSCSCAMSPPKDQTLVVRERVCIYHVLDIDRKIVIIWGILMLVFLENLLHIHELNFIGPMMQNIVTGNIFWSKPFKISYKILQLK